MKEMRSIWLSIPSFPSELSSCQFNFVLDLVIIWTVLMLSSRGEDEG
jgi:hypothetical protein